MTAPERAPPCCCSVAAPPVEPRGVLVSMSCAMETRTTFQKTKDEKPRSTMLELCIPHGARRRAVAEQSFAVVGAVCTPWLRGFV